MKIKCPQKYSELWDERGNLIKVYDKNGKDVTLIRAEPSFLFTPVNTHMDTYPVISGRGSIGFGVMQYKGVPIITGTYNSSSDPYMIYISDEAQKMLVPPTFIQDKQYLSRRKLKIDKTLIEIPRY